MTSTSKSTPGSEYRQRALGENRHKILRAATELFLEHGYDRTSLAKIARAADVSTATLFKRFPTKAALFDAIVSEHWALDERPTDLPQPGDPRSGLTTIGRRYVELMTQDDMVALFRIVIAEAPQFPHLSERHFSLGKLPFWEAVRSYLESESSTGTLQVDDSDLAATHFLGMIATFSFWPRLLLIDYNPSRAAMHSEVDEAVDMMLAKYRPSDGRGSGGPDQRS